MDKEVLKHKCYIGRESGVFVRLDKELIVSIK